MTIKQINQYIKKFFAHFGTVIEHKYWVFRYCFKCGIIWRGIKHDISKFYPTEFLESVKYYTGTSSPIDECKRINGVSNAWMHHKGRNSHHYEYWVDSLDKGGIPLEMPYKCAVEMLCDFLGAGRAYSGNKFNYKSEWEWWLNKLETNPKINYKTKYFITVILFNLMIAETENDTEKMNMVLSKFYLKIIYDNKCIYSDNSFNDFLNKCKNYKGTTEGILLYIIEGDEE